MLAHVRKSIYFSAANNSNKEIWHMAKVSIKSEKLTPFGGIYFTNKEFNALKRI